MSHCSINLEDAPDGLIDIRVVHTGGYDPHSNAHRLSLQIIKWLDEQAESKQEVTRDA